MCLRESVYLSRGISISKTSRIQLKKTGIQRALEANSLCMLSYRDAGTSPLCSGILAQSANRASDYSILAVKNID
jgi:hypothetical protein